MRSNLPWSQTVFTSLNLRRACATGLLLAVTACDGGKNPDDDTDDAGDTDVALHTVGGTVTGLAGTGLVLHLDGGEDLPIAADGAFTFATALASGATYAVTVTSDPTCPVRRCAVSSGSGTVGDADVSDVTVTCAPPKTRLFAANWNTESVWITDDVIGALDAGSKTTRKLEGASTRLTDSSAPKIAVDGPRDLMFVAAGAETLVFDHASTIDGNVAPVRSIKPLGLDFAFSVALDPVRDVLYIGGSDMTGTSVVSVISNASTQDGEVTPDATVTVNARNLSVDTDHDRLFVGGFYDETVSVFDDASALQNTTTPTRTVTWTADTTGFNGPAGMWFDPCSDRLYLGSNFHTPGGNYLVVLPGASTLDGAVDLDADSVARWSDAQSIALVGDDAGNLFTFEDSANGVQIHRDVYAWTGDVDETKTTLWDVADMTYGAAAVTY